MTHADRLEEIDTKLIQAAAVHHLLVQNDAFECVGRDTISNSLWVIGSLIEDAGKLLDEFREMKA